MPRVPPGPRLFCSLVGVLPGVQESQIPPGRVFPWDRGSKTEHDDESMDIADGRDSNITVEVEVLPGALDVFARSRAGNAKA